jgi:hypothetical protein
VRPLGSPEFSVTDPNRIVLPTAAEGSAVQRVCPGNVWRLPKRDAARVVSRQTHVIDNFFELRMMAKRIEPRILH